MGNDSGTYLFGMHVAHGADRLEASAGATYEAISRHQPRLWKRGGGDRLAWFGHPRRRRVLLLLALFSLQGLALCGRSCVRSLAPASSAWPATAATRSGLRDGALDLAQEPTRRTPSRRRRALLGVKRGFHHVLRLCTGLAVAVPAEHPRHAKLYVDVDSPGDLQSRFYRGEYLRATQKLVHTWSRGKELSANGVRRETGGGAVRRGGALRASPILFRALPSHLPYSCRLSSPSSCYYLPRSPARP